MKVLNIHKRVIHQPKAKVVELLGTLSTREDKVWPVKNWPRMELDKGIRIGSKGGHGPIRYFVNGHIAGQLVEFKFTYPKNFNGVHRLEVTALENDKTEIIHTIEMRTSGKDTLSWIFFVRALHDALIEDAFDNVENHFDDKNRTSSWSFWVKFCRAILKSKK